MEEEGLEPTIMVDVGAFHGDVYVQGSTFVGGYKESLLLILKEIYQSISIEDDDKYIVW